MLFLLQGKTVNVLLVFRLDFVRGGNYDNNSIAGVFYFNNNHGGINNNESFRLVLSIL